MPDHSLAISALRVSKPMLKASGILLIIVSLALRCAGADALQMELAHAHPGSVIRVNGAHTGKFVTRVSGTAEAPITIEGDDAAVLIGASADDPVLQIKHSYYRVKNIRVRGGQKGVVVAAAAHGILEGVQVSDTGEAGYEFRRTGTEYWLVRDCSARRTGLEGKYGEGFYVGDATGNWLTNTADTPGYITFDHCYASDTVNDGWDFKEGAHHIKVVNCVADMTNSAPLPAASLPYDHTGGYCRADYVQYINFRIANLSEGADLDALGLYQKKGRDGVTYGHHIELKNVRCENIPKGALVYIESQKMDVKIYDDCAGENVGSRFRRGSAKGMAMPAGKFVEMQWDGEGGGVYGGTRNGR
jgi:hypothetical protein